MLENGVKCTCTSSGKVVSHRVANVKVHIIGETAGIKIVINFTDKKETINIFCIRQSSDSFNFLKNCATAIVREKSIFTENNQEYY